MTSCSFKNDLHLDLAFSQVSIAYERLTRMQNHEAHARVGISFLVETYLLKSELMFDQMSISPTHVNNMLRT